MPDNRIEFNYTARDVASAQRMRLLKSGQFKGILIFWAAGVVFLAMNILFPQTFQIIQGVNWVLIAELSLVYVVTILVLMFVTPYVDFAFNRFWRLRLALSFSEKQLQLALAKPAKKPKGGKKSSGLILQWDELRQVLENGRVYVISYGPQAKFFVVPKSAFLKPGSEQRFRELLGQSGAKFGVQASKAA